MGCAVHGQGQHSVHSAERLAWVSPLEMRESTCSRLQLEGAAAEKLLQTDAVALLSWEMEGQTTCSVQICFLQSLILFAFLFLREPSCCVLVRGWCLFLDAPKALMGLCEFWCPVCSWTGGTPWINIPNSLCAWITHAQHHLLVLSPEPARKAFLLGRKCLIRRFYIQLSHFGNGAGSSMSCLLIRILFIQLWPIRASCWDIPDLHPLLERSCL